MEWVKEFYAKQGEWTGLYFEDINQFHREKVSSLLKFTDHPPKKILELGAGGGQFTVCAAMQGYDVTAVELVPASVSHMHQLARRYELKGSLNIIKGDFYEVELSNDYDVVCYWDGFGIGSDQDQIRLLKRISSWLKDQGTALIDIYTPWYWSKVAGIEMEIGCNKRRYGFDPDQCRMLDTWWKSENYDGAVTQALRCYSPADLRLLLANTGLCLETIEPGGAMDYDRWQYSESVPLDQAMSYLARLVKDC